MIVVVPSGGLSTLASTMHSLLSGVLFVRGVVGSDPCATDVLRFSACAAQVRHHHLCSEVAFAQSWLACQVVVLAARFTARRHTHGNGSTRKHSLPFSRYVTDRGGAWLSPDIICRCIAMPVLTGHARSKIPPLSKLLECVPLPVTFLISFVRNAHDFTHSAAD